MTMPLDRKQLDRLLTLDDNRLRAVLGRLLASYGVDVSRVPLDTLDVGALRALLQNATDEDIERFLQMFNAKNAAPSGS